MPEPVAEVSEKAKKILEEKGWKRGPEGLLLPPPVEYPEHFPGYGKELSQLGVEFYKAQTRVAAAQKQLSKVAAPVRFEFTVTRPTFFGFMMPWTLPWQPGEAALREEEGILAQQEFDMAMQELKSTEWRGMVMTRLPDYLGNPLFRIEKPEDITNYLASDSMTDSDTAWLTDIFDRLKHLSNILPEGFVGDAMEAQAKVLDEILTAPKLELRAVHNLTVDEIAKSFAFGVAELPQGMSEEEVRNMLGRMDMQDEELLEHKEWLDERAKEWALESDRLNLIRAGTVLAEAPELTPWEFTKLVFTQPMMATVELLDKYFNILPRPLYTAAVIGVHKLFKTPEDTAAARLEEQYNFFRSMGESSWSAYSMAFNEWDAPWWLKLMGEAFFDPASYIGLGMATAAGYKLGTGLTKVGIRGLGTRIGPWIGAIENGYVAGADAVFRVGIKAVLSPIKGTFWLTGAGYQIPRTYTMMARNFARESYKKFSSVLQRSFPEVRSLKGLTAKDAIDTGKNIIDQAIARPTEGWDAAVKAGAPLLEFNYIDDVVARSMTREVVEDVVFDTPRLVRFNNEVLNMFSGQGERVTAGKIIADLGQEATEDLVTKLSAKLVTFRHKVADTAKAALKGDMADDVLMNTFNRLEGIRYTNLHSPLTKHMNQAGRSASWHSRVADRVLYSSALVALERRLVMPVARWNLLFTNFGPYNFLENMQRSFLGGAEVLYPRSYSGVAETNRLFKGLANAPYELQMFERGEMRLAQAMVDPKTGRAAVFKGGKVPLITRSVQIPEKVPFLGGKTVGAKINIAGRDHYLASFQDAYDMWAHFNSMQVAYDYQVHYMKALAEIAPDDMGKLTEIISKYKSQLDNISSIHPTDARDIERVLLQDATVGPEAVRLHQALDVLEFERRQVSKELGKTFDKCTDVRMVTKKGIRDEVLDGSIFTDIDGRVAAFVEQERELSLISLKNQINVLKDEADTITRIYTGKASLLDDLGIDLSLGRAEVIGLPEVGFQRSPLMLEGRQVGSVHFRPGATPDEIVFDLLEITEAGLVNRQFMKDTELLLHNLAKERGASKVTVVAKEQHKLIYTEAGYVKSPLGFTKETMQPPAAPTNINDFLGDMQNITAMVEGTGERIHDYRKLTELRKAKLLPGEMDDFEVGSAKLLAEFMETSEEQLTRIMNQLVKGAEGAGLNEAQLARLTDLDSISRLELENILATRGKIAEIEAIIPRTAKGRRNDRFWTQQRAQKAAIWDEFDVNARRFKSLRLRASRNFLNSVDGQVSWQSTMTSADASMWSKGSAFESTLYHGTPSANVARIKQAGFDVGEGEFLFLSKTRKGASEFGEVLPVKVNVSRMATLDFSAPSTIQKVGSKYAVGSDEWVDDVLNWFGKEHKRLISEGYDAVDLVAHPATQAPLGQSQVIVSNPKNVTVIDSGATVASKTSTKAFVPDFIPEVVTELTPNHLAYLFGVTGDDLYRGLTRVQHHITIRPREDFILHASEQADAYAARLGKTAADIGFTDDAIGEVYDQLWRNLGVEPTILTPDSPTVMQLEEIRQEITRLHAANKIPESDIVKWRKYINSVADDVEKLPAHTTAKEQWWTTKESAITKSRDMHALAYPTYDDANIIDESMRAIFPFWNYEMFRWRWIPRTAMRTPGTMTGIARYMDYTDQGYIPIPGTDLQVNLLRGSIWMGGLRSFYLRDFPEYYDVMPGMEFIDYIGRAGYFMGIHGMLPIVAFGAATGKPEIGQLAPAWVRTGLSGLRTLSPQHIGAVLEHIYPDRFRDYMVMLTLGEEGYDADLIWRKMQTGEKLTPEEEKLWLNAANRVDGVKGILMQQTGLFRIRPQEFSEIRKSMRLAIEEATGVSVAVQEQIDHQYPVTGKRFSDYYHLDVYQTKLLYEWETYRRWQGVTTPLYPSSWQLEDIRRTEYYEELEKVYNEARTVGIYEDDKLIRPSMVEMNRQFVEGEIGPDQWMGFRSDLVGSLAEAARVLGESPAYKDVPKTFEEMAERQEERNIPAMVQTPDQELLYYYYELSPEYKWNWESQRMERDFDTYYAYIDILLESLDAPHRERLLQRIQADWTPLEKLYWQISREYMRPYRNLREIVLREYEPEQIQQIRRFEVAPAAEREQLREVVGPDGLKLISGYQKRLREARQRLRILDPETDAWLNFFGTTTALLTSEAKEVYEELRKKYLTKDMIK